METAEEIIMTLIPVFEIGVWNAWIFMVLLFLYILLSVQVFKDVGKKIAHGEEVIRLSYGNTR